MNVEIFNNLQKVKDVYKSTGDYRRKAKTTEEYARLFGVNIKEAQKKLTILARNGFFD